MVAFARHDPSNCTQRLQTVWNTVWGWLKTENVPLRVTAGNALSTMARYCVSTEAIQIACTSRSNSIKWDKSVLGGIIIQISSSLDALQYARAIPLILKITSSLISRLRLRPGLAAGSNRPPTSAELLLSDLVKKVGNMRTQTRFEYREQADMVLGMAIEVMGPEVFLAILPLNILPS